ncbi:MAG: YbeD family protein [Deferrisomatales bacterium]
MAARVPAVDDCRIPVEELLEFPTEFAFKVIGHHTREFPHRAVQAVRGALGGERPVAFRTRLSRAGTYISTTLTARVDSADELRAAYAALRALDGVITTL